MREVLLTLHVLTAMVTVGWLLTQAMLTPRAIRDGNAGALRFTEGAARRIGPAAGLVLLLGIALVLRQSDDYAEFKHAWVNLAMLLFILAMVNGAVLIAGAERRALAKLEAGQPAGEEAKRVSMLAGVNMVLLVAIIWLMVDKPWL